MQVQSPGLHRRRLLRTDFLIWSSSGKVGPVCAGPLATPNEIRPDDAALVQCTDLDDAGEFRRGKLNLGEHQPVNSNYRPPVRGDAPACATAVWPELERI